MVLRPLKLNGKEDLRSKSSSAKQQFTFPTKNLPVLGQGEKGLCVLGGDAGDILNRHTVEVCKDLGNVGEHSRVAHLAAMGDGRHIWAIGFNE